ASLLGRQHKSRAARAPVRPFFLPREETRPDPGAAEAARDQLRRLSMPPPLRHLVEPLQRGQTRSPAQALSKVVWQLRQARLRRLSVTASAGFSSVLVFIGLIWAFQAPNVSGIAPRLGISRRIHPDSPRIHPGFPRESGQVRQ